MRKWMNFACGYLASIYYARMIEFVLKIIVSLSEIHPRTPKFAMNPVGNSKDEVVFLCSERAISTFSKLSVFPLINLELHCEILEVIRFLNFFIKNVFLDKPK